MSAPGRRAGVALLVLTGACALVPVAYGFPLDAPTPTPKPGATAVATAKPVATTRPLATPGATAQPVATPIGTPKSVATPAGTAQPVSTPIATPKPAATALPVSTAIATPRPASTPAAVAASKHDPRVLGDMDCSACHTTDGWKMAGTTGGGGGGGFDHARTGFPLTGEHSGAACLGCHVPGRPITRECAGCHTDSHEGRLGASCDGCHTARGWTDVQASAAHRRTRFPLTGMHALIECTECHLRASDQGFSDTPADCFACHEAEYRSNDNHPPHEGDPVTGQGFFSRDCAGCHTTAGWVPAFLPAVFLAIEAGPAGRERHEAKFPIAHGTHRDAECADCHSGRDDGRGRVDCTGCHEHSPLRLTATHRGYPGNGDGCTRCHPGGVRR